MAKTLLQYVRKHFRRIIKAIITIFIGAIFLIVLGAWISYEIQENSYGRFNAFRPISETLRYPMYLTTFFYILGGCFVFFGLTMLVEDNADGISALIGWGVIIWNMCQEIYQVVRNPYPDSHFLDIVVGILAVKLFLLYVKRFFPKESP